MEKLPKNLKIVWTQGTRCFVEVTTKNSRGEIEAIDWHSDEENNQLSDRAMYLWFRAAIELAARKPGKEVTFLRCDLDTEPETANNRPFRGTHDVKTIRWADHVYKARFG